MNTLMNRKHDTVLVWEAYKAIYKESPDTVKDADQNSIFNWNSKSQLTSTFMRIGSRWLLAGVNILKEESKKNDVDIVHSNLFGTVIADEIMKVLPQSLKKFNFAKAYTSNNTDATYKFIKQVFRTSQLLTDILKEYTKHNEAEDFLDLIAEEIAAYIDPKIKEFRAKNNFREFSLETIFFVPDESETRIWFDCGRLWINPQTKGHTIPGLIISMWNPPEKDNKNKIQEELSKILKSEGYKFTHIAWDGDKDIDPYQKHIRASKLSVNKQTTWDDIKYR
jgi:hypothetical protein